MTDYNEQPQEGNKPDMIVNVERPAGQNKTRLSRIGVAFKHDKGEGYTILLDAQPVPLNGEIKLVMFPPKN